jgi:hypothetical protein
MTSQIWVSLPNRHLRPAPILQIAKPLATTGIYRPVLAMICPLEIDPSEVQAISGRRSAPDLTAEYERTD